MDFSERKLLFSSLMLATEEGREMAALFPGLGEEAEIGDLSDRILLFSSGDRTLSVLFLAPEALFFGGGERGCSRTGVDHPG